MQYRNDRYGNPISALRFGCMRWTQKLGKIDIDKAEKEVMAAFEAGVNYYDTAYIYPGSEAALGEILERNHIRDKVNIATKLPHYLLKDNKSPEDFFAEELKRLRTDHVDYYLMHMLTDVKTWERLKASGVTEWLDQKKQAGQIRQVGFSYHGNSDMFIQLLESYPWDFCQIQYNYMDENTQAGRTGLEKAAELGIPVVIMEPLRGGRLASALPKGAKAVFAKADPKRTPVDWALQWLWDQKGIMCVLSGMNSEQMVQENVSSAERSGIGSLTEDEKKVYGDVLQAIQAKLKVGCTGCRYCMPCPKGVDIPGVFAAYNRRYSDGKIAGWKDYIMCTAIRKDETTPSACVGCGRCEQHCPQHIEIRKELKNAQKTLEGPVYKIGKKVIKKFMKY